MKTILLKIGKFKFKADKHIPIIIVVSLILVGSSFFSYNKISSLQNIIQSLVQERDKNLVELQQIGEELEEMKNQDQYKRNEDLQSTIKNIETTYDKAVSVYEELLDLKDKTKDTKDYDETFTKVIVSLKERDYVSASDKLTSLSTKIKEEEKKIAAAFQIPKSVPENNAPPGGGYGRQKVVTDSGTFLVSIIAADIKTTRVIIDTASDSDCHNECPTIPLAELVSRNGAWAGVHGAYACPAEYPSCAGKTNSFDLLIMNKNKHYFNSDNNVYSANPAVIFGNGYVRFVQHTQEWGRDTGVDGVISNFPLLLFNGEIKFGGNEDSKMTIKSSRGFVANKENTVYIGVVFNATVADSAHVMKSLGMENAMNLDGGGTTALWHGGYKAGPGRNLTNAILFLNR